MSDKYIQSLEESDKYFLRKLFDTTVSTPIESLYIESAAIPIWFIDWRKADVLLVNFTRGANEIVKRVFQLWKNFQVKKWTGSV